ncbi:MAG: carboxypeptidase-like regulatory domain-containing protein [Chlamydiae bacterium]|nr:carboxypeptidase-like regulatory domain-containing protein [Chlamydiota bacterium]
MKRRKDLGTIGGVIRDRYSNQPVPNALVRINNERVLTDNAGYFSSALPPGSYTPKIELTPNQLIACSEEQKVHVRAGHHTSCNDHLVTDSGQIQGKVVLYEPSIEMESLERLFELDDFDFEYIEAELLAGMRVSISREQGREVYSTITNGNGSFLFNNLRPGQWSVVLIPNHQIPDGHKISQSEYLVNIQSGEKKELLFQVMPEIRSIKKMEPKKTSSNLCN